MKATSARQASSAPSPPLAAVLVVIFTVVDGDLQALLIQRSGEPHRGLWAIPGGRLAPGEALHEAAVRKLEDETGVRDVYLEQLYTFSHLDDVTPGGAVAVAYFALVDQQRVRLSERTDWRPAWFSMHRLPQLAFRNEELLDYALQRLRYKLEYTNVAYSLLPPRFTLSQLQRVYESILGQELDKRNFRKRMLSLEIIEATDEHQAEGAGRPALLYRFKSQTPVQL